MSPNYHSTEGFAINENRRDSLILRSSKEIPQNWLMTHNAHRRRRVMATERDAEDNE